MSDVIILRQADKAVSQQGKRSGLSVVVAEGPISAMPFGRALIAAPGQPIPWEMIGYGYHFLERWDVAAPLWRYGVLAQDVGTPAERKRTEKVTRDLRVLLYAHELVFVRDSADGRALLRAWEEELVDSQEPRLAFLRAVYRVKPIFCTLPQSWIGGKYRARSAAQAIERADRRAMALAPGQPRPPAPSPRVGRVRPAGGGLVRVQVKPGVWVTCKPGQEQATLTRFRKGQDPRGKGEE